MSQDRDEYRIVTTLPILAPTQYRIPLMQYMNAHGFDFTTLLSGWGTTLMQPFRTIMILVFTTAKNELTEAEAMQIGNDIVAILDQDTQLISVQKTVVSRLD